ncbi:MAG: hypothetical protein AB7S36_17590, partial [Planctomycetota bacterium]
MPPELPGVAQKLPNPFDARVVSGPYDPSHVICVETLIHNARNQLLRVFERHQKDPLAPLPIATVVGPTGSGKSHLLRIITETMHKPGRPHSGFVVDVSPRDFGSRPHASVGDDADFLLHRIEAALMRSRLPGLAGLRMIDLYGQAIARECLQTLGEGGLQLPRRATQFWKRQELPHNVLHTLTRSSRPDAPLAELVAPLPAHVRESMIDRLCETASKSPKQPGLRVALLRQAFMPGSVADIFSGKTGGKAGTGVRDPLRWFADFAQFAHDVGRPLLLVFDQFENLRVAAAGGDLNVLVNAFIQRLIDVLTRLHELADADVRPAAGERKLSPSHAAHLPLVVLSVIDEYDPTLLSEEHVKGRLPWLNERERAIRIEPAVKRMRDFRLARELAQGYLDEFWMAPEGQPFAGMALGRALWPFGEEPLKLLHARLAPHTATPRMWLEMCARVWDRLVAEGQQGEFEQRLARWKAEMQATASPASVSTDSSGADSTADDINTYADNVYAAVKPPRDSGTVELPSPTDASTSGPAGPGVKPRLAADARAALAPQRDPVPARASDIQLPTVPAESTVAPEPKPEPKPLPVTAIAVSPPVTPPTVAEPFQPGRFINHLAKHAGFRHEVAELCGQSTRARAQEGAEHLFACLNLAITHRIGGLVNSPPDWLPSGDTAFTVRSNGHRVLAFVTSGSTTGVQNDWERAQKLASEARADDLLFMRTRESQFPFDVPPRVGSTAVQARWKVTQDWS